MTGHETMDEKTFQRLKDAFCAQSVIENERKSIADFELAHFLGMGKTAEEVVERIARHAASLADDTAKLLVDGLSRHIPTKTERDGPFECEICGCAYRGTKAVFGGADVCIHCALYMINILPFRRQAPSKKRRINELTRRLAGSHKDCLTCSVMLDASKRIEQLSVQRGSGKGGEPTK